MVRKLIIIGLLSLAVILLAMPAGASLVPMSWGFPIMNQANTLTSMENTVAQSTDNEAAAVSFPTVSTAGCGALGTAFPTITQTADKNDLLADNKFMQQTQSFSYAYPFLSIGGSPVPSMGLM